MPFGALIVICTISVASYHVVVACKYKSLKTTVKSASHEILYHLMRSGIIDVYRMYKIRIMGEKNPNLFNLDNLKPFPKCK
jgi:hypothetical protein